MASSTTHVIEIETGIGEPAFIPLTLGQELQPISVGKKGMWRIESPRVLDVHAFVYFDGSSLFLQSAEEESAASVDGHRVGKAWTELHAPCKIEIGGARLRFRSLVGDAEGAATTAMGAPPVKGSPGRVLEDAPASGPTRQHVRAPDPQTLPKNERPFKPGEFAARPDDDSTRVAPLESTGAQRVQLGTSGPLPAAGRPIEDDDVRTRADVAVRPPARIASGPMQPPGATGPFPAVGVQPVQSLGALPVAMGPMPTGPMMPPPGGMPMGPMGPMGPGMMPPQAPGSMPNMNMGSGPYAAQPGYPMAGGSGAYNAMGPMGAPMGSMPPGQMGAPMGSMGPGQMAPMGSMGPGPMGAMPPQQRTAGGLDEYIAKYKELSPPKKILVFIAPLCLLAAFYVLLVDDEPAPGPRTRPTADAGVVEGGVAKQPAVVPPVGAPTSVQPQASCPPGFEPYPGVVAQPGGVIPCIPIGALAAQDAGGGTTASSGGTTATNDPPPAKKDGGTGAHASTTTGQKTLERQAVDYVATGEYVKALAIYEQLRAAHPNNAAYAEAVRILRAKVSTPQGP